MVIRLILSDQKSGKDGQILFHLSQLCFLTESLDIVKRGNILSILLWLIEFLLDVVLASPQRVSVILVLPLDLGPLLSDMFLTRLTTEQ